MQGHPWRGVMVHGLTVQGHSWRDVMMHCRAARQRGEDEESDVESEGTDGEGDYIVAGRRHPPRLPLLTS